MSQRFAVMLRGVSKSFPGVRALSDVDLTLRSGEIHGLLGQNGAGKSTLIKVLGGAMSPDSGSIVVGDTPVEFSLPAQAREAGIAIVHQDLQLLPNLSVADNVTVGSPSVRRIGPLLVRDRRTDSEVARKHLSELGIELDVHQSAGSLRPAERKLLEVARALAGDDIRVLVLDEPTASLEPREAEQLFALLARLRDRGVAIVFVSHKLDEVFHICDAVTVLRDGNVVRTAPIAELKMAELVRLVAGKDLAQVAIDKRTTGDTLLTARQVTVGAVGPADLQLREGEVVAITGLLGSGNEEFGRAVASARRRDGGEVRLKDRQLPPADRVRASSLGLGFVPEDRKTEAVVPHLTVEQNIALASIPKVARKGGLSRRLMREQAEHFIDLLDIRPPYPDMQLGMLSGGNQQKVILARWLASEATVLVLEEPTHGLDVGAKAEIQSLLQRFADGPRAVLMISSELAEIVQLSDRIGVFRGGQLVATLPRGASQHEVATHVVTPAPGNEA